jgi:hygromycin-B 4-O-kinase
MTIHLDQVRQFLTERYSPEQVARAGAGVWSAAFTFEHHGQPLVARFGRHVEDFRKDERAATLYGTRIPVPRVLEIGEAFDGYVCAISELADGEAIDGLPERHLRAALPSLLDTMDALRAAPPPTEIGFGWWPSRGRATHDTWRDALLGIAEDEENSRLAGWRVFLRANAEWSRIFDDAADRLAALADACPDGVRHVIHGDLTAGNVLVVDGAVSAVFDWGNSLVGDSLYDVAWLVFWSPWHPGLDADFIVSETRRRCAETGVDVENFDERLRCCQLHIALDSMAYNAFRRDEVNLSGTIDRLLPLIDAPIERPRTHALRA